MKTGVFGVVAAALLMCFTGVNARAQGGGDVFLGYTYMLDNFNANNFCGSSGCFVDPGRHGYNLAFAWSFNPNIAMEANFSGNHGTTTVFSSTYGTSSDIGRQSSDVVTALFGPRLTYPIGMTNFGIYTHFLVGVLHDRETFGEQCCTTSASVNTVNFKGTGFGMKVGGGVDWHRGHWGIRILELNYIHGDGQGTFTCSGCAGETNSGNGSAKDFQMATGVLYRWGGKK